MRTLLILASLMVGCAPVRLAENRKEEVACQPIPGVSIEDLAAEAECEAPGWVPGSNEPAEYQACVRDEECVKAVFYECCGERHVPLNRQRACGQHGPERYCEVECGPTKKVWPSEAQCQRAACVDQRCALIP